MKREDKININLTVEELYETESIINLHDVFLPANLSCVSNTNKKEFYFYQNNKEIPHKFNTKLKGYLLPKEKYDWLIELLKKEKKNNEIRINRINYLLKELTSHNTDKEMK